MHPLLLIITATIVNSLISLIGVFSFMLKEKLLDKIIISLVALSAGVLLSGAFLHLIPESLEHLSPMAVNLCVLIGFILFFLMEKFLYWHHCHEGKCNLHPVGYLILFGDGIHNFIDGLIIGVSFIVGTGFGIITSLLIIGHEIPQELGDFGVLVYSGFGKAKALITNFISQLSCILGGIIGYFLSNNVEKITPFILPFAAGGFIYISASDLVPQLHKEQHPKKLRSFAFFIAGILFMLMMTLIAHV